MLTTLCIDYCFQDCTETQKRLFFSYSAIGKLWIGLTGVDAVFGSCHMFFWLVWDCVEQTWCICSSFPYIHEESDQSSATYSAVDSPSIWHSLNCLWPSGYELLQLSLDYEQLMATHLMYHLGGPSHPFLILLNYSGTCEVEHHFHQKFYAFCVCP